ncbi:hypothetical protein D9M72_390390 [compost metagenome]
MARFDLLADPAEQLGIELLHPGELLRRRAGENEVRRLVHQGHDVGERARALADGLPDGPQPRRIDVRVSCGDQLMGGGIRRTGENLSQGCAACRGGAGNIVRIHDVQHPFQGAQDLVAARQFHRELMHESAERPYVLLQFPHRLVELGDGHGAQPVFGVASRCCLVTVGHGCESPPLGNIGVGGGLHVEVHCHPAAEELQWNVLVPGRDGLDDGAVRPPGDPFALKARELPGEPQVHHYFHRGIGSRAPGIGHLTLQPQPFGAPGAAPRRSVFQRHEVVAEGLQNGDRLVRNVPGAEVQRNAAGVHRGVHAFAHEAVKTDFRDAAVVVQCSPL